jgi:hypothetical protein
MGVFSNICFDGARLQPRRPEPTRMRALAPEETRRFI